MSTVLLDPDTRTAEMTRRVVTEFRELPGMRLTKCQVKRLWNLSSDECEAVLEQLVESQLIACDETGHYGLRAA